MQQITTNHEIPECGCCYAKFDAQQSQPRLFPRCGHTVCWRCLKSMVGVSMARASQTLCCPFCKAGDLDWVEASGRGSIISHTTVHRTHHDGFNAEAPYLFAAVALEEGPCLYAQLPGAPVDGASLVGRPVTVDFAPHGPGLKIPVFRLAGN